MQRPTTLKEVEMQYGKPGRGLMIKDELENFLIEVCFLILILLGVAFLWM